MAQKKKVKKIAKKAAPKPVIKKTAVKTSRIRGLAAAAENVEASTATLHVEFRSVNPGLSKLTATHDDEEQTIDQSGPISFSNVKIGDTIDIDGDSPGKTIVTVSGVNTDPVRMEFEPGQHISGIFFIVP